VIMVSPTVSDETKSCFGPMGCSGTLGALSEMHACSSLFVFLVLRTVHKQHKEHPLMHVLIFPRAPTAPKSTSNHPTIDPLVILEFRMTRRFYRMIILIEACHPGLMRKHAFLEGIPLKLLQSPRNWRGIAKVRSQMYFHWSYDMDAIKGTHKK
jgi:hypothetical protein